MIKKVKIGFLLDECEKLANLGLRTLVLTQKKLKKNEYEDWAIRFQEAQMSLENRDVNFLKCCNKNYH
jgi:hypothetical protein